MKDSYWIKLSDSITIGSDWTELRPSPPLNADKDIESIALQLEPPFEDGEQPAAGKSTGFGIRLPDDRIINPDIEVVDDQGTTYHLVHAGSKNRASLYGLPYPREWPRDRRYVTVRMRSSEQIRCKAIYWFADSSKDWK